MRTKRGWLVTALGMGFGLFMSTCSSSGEGSGFSSGLDTMKPLSGLSDEDVRQLCQAVEAWTMTVFTPEKAREYSCRLSAISAAYATRPESDADLQTNCRMRYDECVMRMGATSTPATPVQARMCARPPATCMATVGELEECLTDLGTAYEKLLESAPACEALTVGNMPQRQTQAGDPETCKLYAAHCSATPMTTQRPPTDER